VGALRSDVVLDGEIVAIDGKGRPSFQALQHRASERHAVVYYVFDLLALDGKDLTREPLEKRRAALSNVVRVPQSFCRTRFAALPNKSNVPCASSGWKAS
jgi:ATP-dependent DNA ligase